MKDTSLTSCCDMVPDAGTLSSTASAAAMGLAFDPLVMAPRRALVRSLEFFSRNVDILKIYMYAHTHGLI